jgi:ribonuclease E
MEMSRQRIRTSVLESSTEKCPHCGGTGHVRSVSSVALQLLRTIEETLLKGPTHNLIIRTRPEIALYVLNNKRAHLRGLEERFKVTLTVNADEEVGGQVGFTIDRGEQVMTLDQAKALLAQQADSAPALIEEEEPEVAAEDEDSEAGAGEGEHAERSEHITEVADDPEPMHGDGGHDGDRPRDGDRSRDGSRGGRRRRRRGRGGRGGEDREGGHFQQPRHETTPREAGEFSSDPQGRQPSAEFSAGEMLPQQGIGQPQAEGGEHEGNGPRDGDGNGELRRRRRGRRGGRRNRRDREPTNGDFAAAPSRETHERPDTNERPEWSPPPQAHTPESAYAAPAPRFEPPAPQAIASEPAAAPSPAHEPPRRRSTVREPAPVFSGGGAPVVTPMPAPQPPPSPIVTSTAEADANKPKRSGWWAKRLLGGD